MSNIYLHLLYLRLNKILRIITNTQWFIQNENLHKDHQITKIQDYIRIFTKKLFTILFWAVFFVKIYSSALLKEYLELINDNIDEFDEILIHHFLCTYFCCLK
jgi:hypothetical protein